MSSICKGKLIILDSKKNFGKLVLPNGEETSVVTFPPNYETGDIVQFRRIKMGTGEKILIESGVSETRYYGYILLKKKSKIKDQNKSFLPLILTTYPKQIGLIGFDSNLGFSPEHSNNSVSFDLHKDSQGKLRAINIRQIDDNERYKCSQSTFGSIQVEKELIQDGFVRSIKKYVDLPDIKKGVVTRIIPRVDKSYYGFVSDGSKDYYFSDIAFNNCFERSAQVGEEVIFSAFPPKDDNKLAIKVFYTSYPQSVLPPKQQTCVINVNNKDIVFYLSSYTNTYNKDPEVGDFVKVNTSTSTPRLMDTAEKTVPVNVFHSLGKKKKPNTGTIKDYYQERGFGFVTGEDNQDYFFHINSFKESDTLPKPGDKVEFSLVYDDLKESYKVRYMKRPGKTYCSEETFTNFVEPNPNDLFLAYTDNEVIKEIHRVDLTDLPYAVAYYKDSSVKTDHFLTAIETMISHNFQDQTIKQATLIEQRKDLLNELIADSIRNNNVFALEKYQTRLQQLYYSPSKLKSCDGLAPQYNLIPEPTEFIEPPITDLAWNFSEPPRHVIGKIFSRIFGKDEFKEIQYDLKWNITLGGKPIVPEVKYDDSPWLIDFEDVKEPMNLPDTDKYLEIDINNK